MLLVSKIYPSFNYQLFLKGHIRIKICVHSILSTFTTHTVTINHFKTDGNADIDTAFTWMYYANYGAVQTNHIYRHDSTVHLERTVYNSKKVQSLIKFVSLIMPTSKEQPMIERRKHH